MAKRRHSQLFDLGEKAYEKGGIALDGNYHALLYAFSVMLAEATKKPTTKKRSDDQKKLVLSPQEVFTTIRDRCGTNVACEPVDTRWFGRLGRRMQDIPDLETDDLMRLVSFINGGGVATWPTVFTFSALIKWLPEMIAKARKEQVGTEAVTKQVRSAFE
jgi:hypothetical protein